MASNNNSNEDTTMRTKETKAQKALGALALRLESQQGQARARTLDMGDVIDLIEEALTDGWATTGRARVASSYNNPAYATAGDAMVSDSQVIVGIDRHYAGSATPLRLSSVASNWSRAAQDRHAARIAESVRLVHGGERGQWCGAVLRREECIIITTRTAHKIVRDWRA